LQNADEITRELKTQADFLKDREPVYERMLTLLAEAIRGEFGGRLERLWSGRAFHSSYERPLLLLAAIRYDALCEGSTHPLYRALVAEAADADAVTPSAFAEAIAPARERVDAALSRRAVQTNETTRAVTWLWPAHLLWAAGVRSEIALVDLGTSAGLNLIADRLPALWTDEDGRPVPIEPRPGVGQRLGLDISPLDIRDPDNAMWLRACVWPGDRARRERLEAAIRTFIGSGAGESPRLAACPLQDAPARLRELPPELFVLTMQTVVRDYLGPEDRARYEGRMRAFLASRPGSAVHTELEVEPASLAVAGRSATLIARFADAGGGMHELLLARTHPHPRQLFTDRGAVASFTAAFGARQT
jgi:hypothetical protein